MAPAAIRYSMHPGFRMEAAYARNLEERTGRSLEEWVRLVRREGPPEEPERRRWLKAEHGLSTSYTRWIAGAAEGKEMGSAGYDPSAYVERLYAGPKAGLRPLHDRLCRLALSLGKDVKVCPCETMVPFFRKFAFAELRPATATRLDLGLALGDAKPGGRLASVAVAMGNRITHRISLGSVAEVDGEVEARLREAYDLGNETRKRDASPKVVPADLAGLLRKSAKAKATFEGMTPRMKAEWISWITEPKKPETRVKRLERAAERLGKGRKTIY
jgi:hypothetical protein